MLPLSIAVCSILVVGCNAAVDAIGAGDVGRYWAALRGHGHTESAQPAPHDRANREKHNRRARGHNE